MYKKIVYVITSTLFLSAVVYCYITAQFSCSSAYDINKLEIWKKDNFNKISSLYKETPKIIIDFDTHSCKKKALMIINYNNIGEQKIVFNMIGKELNGMPVIYMNR